MNIEEICEKYGITNYKINNGLVDVDCSVYLFYNELTELPLNFGEISGDFNCGNNNLTTLKGCPIRVNGDFCFGFNKLTKLDYLPEFIGRNFYCNANELKTFTNLEKCWLVGEIYCSGNPIHEIFSLFKGKDWNIGEIDRLNMLVKDFSLNELNEWLVEEGYEKVNELEDKEIHEICEKYGITNYKINNGLVDVDGTVIIRDTQLTQLPLSFGEIRGHFNCGNNKLTTLKGCPVRVNGDFRCTLNKLTKLDYLPEFIGGDFICRFNQLKTFINLEKCWLVGRIYCSGNPIYEIFRLFLDKDWNIGEIDKLNMLIKDFSLNELNQWLIEEGYEKVNELENYGR